MRTTRQYTNGTISDTDTEYPQYYDLNGNPKMLYRTSSGAQLHNFTYTYTGNQLTTLSDGSATYSYTYDTRGNMTRDGYHNLNLSYNHLNLLEKVTQNGSTVANYSYLSDGTKLSSVNSSGVGFVYRGSLVYGRSGNTLTLESCGFGGGRLISVSGSSTPHYYVTDHLGSVRVVLNNSGDIVSQHDYYPFGKSHDNPNLQTSPNRYLFNGKESQTFANVPYLDYGARMYDADVLPWLTQDPLLQNYLRFSPYVFCAGNPVKYVDKDGRDLYSINAKGNIKLVRKGGEHRLELVSQGKNVYENGSKVGISVKDGGILKQLSQVKSSRDLYDSGGEKIDTYETRTATTTESGGEDMAKIFMFAGRHTDSEWSLSYGDDGNGNGMYGLQTDGNSKKVNRALSGDGKVEGSIHSHPKSELGVGIEAEKYSMGNDRANSVRSKDQTNKFVYMGTSGNVWQIMLNNSGTATTINNQGSVSASQLSIMLKDK